MQKYVLPPQFDFLNNADIDPIAMYMFEFKYELDRDDLSYIWQNLAPRDYKKTTLESVSNAHKLGENELMTAEDITDPNTRFMVFKVKQRGLNEYDNTLPGATEEQENGYKVSFNWPYDFVSIVELAKVEAKAMYKGDPSEQKISNRAQTNSVPQTNSTPSGITTQENVAASNRY